jgi:uncharacterized protein (DUF983 family)
MVGDVDKNTGRLRALLRLRCPRCLGGAVFYGFWGMYPFCSDCQLQYEREPGYFLGAMYISYGMTMALSFPLVVLLVFLGGLSIQAFLVVLLLLVFLLSPLLFRYSRILWLHWDQFWDPR